MSVGELKKQIRKCVVGLVDKDDKTGWDKVIDEAKKEFESIWDDSTINMERMVQIRLTKEQIFIQEWFKKWFGEYYNE